MKRSRLGSDEFAWLLENTTLDRAYVIATELSECVRNMLLARANQEFSVSAKNSTTYRARNKIAKP